MQIFIAIFCFYFIALYSLKKILYKGCTMRKYSLFIGRTLVGPILDAILTLTFIEKS